MRPRLAIDELIASKPDGAKVDAFLSNRRVPLVEGGSATFLWRGHADRVSLRHWIYGLESSTSLNRVHNTDLWYLTLEIPSGSRVEYKYELHRHGGSEWIEDPLNPNRARDPFGANSVLQGEGYEAPNWTHVDPVARAGTLAPLLFESRFVGRRTGHLYFPARFRRSRQYPLVVVHDGSDYLNYASMKIVLDNLISQVGDPGRDRGLHRLPRSAQRICQSRGPRALLD